MRDLFSGVIPFIYTAESQSFRRAAERLGVTSAAVSKAIARLEEDLGVPLLERTTRRVGLSAEGQLFLSRCREALAQVRAGRDSVAAARRAPRGDIAVSLPFILSQVFIARMPRFLARYPDLRIRARFSDRFSHFIGEGIDVALRIGALDDSTLIAKRLMDTRWVTVAAPSYLGVRGAPRTPSELAAHNCLSFHAPSGQAVPWTFAADGRGEVIERVSVTGNFDTDQGETLLAAAIAGLGVCQVLDFMVVGHLKSGRIVEVLQDHSARGPSVHAMCLPGQRSVPRVRALLDFLADELAA